MDKDMEDKISYFIVGGLASAGIALGILTLSKPDISEVKIFHQDHVPTVMRLYRTGTDGILVEDPKAPGKYIPISSYLEGLDNKYDRQIQEATIEKLVDW